MPVLSVSRLFHVHPTACPDHSASKPCPQPNRFSPSPTPVTCCLKMHGPPTQLLRTASALHLLCPHPAHCCHPNTHRGRPPESLAGARPGGRGARARGSSSSVPSPLKPQQLPRRGRGATPEGHCGCGASVPPVPQHPESWGSLLDTREGGALQGQSAPECLWKSLPARRRVEKLLREGGPGLCGSGGDLAVLSR